MLANDLMAYDIAKKLGISKQVVAYEIKQMLKVDWIIDRNPAINKYKFYRLTDRGKKILDGFGKNEKSRLFKIENAISASIRRERLHQLATSEHLYVQYVAN